MKSKSFIIFASVIAAALVISFAFNATYRKGQKEGYLDGRKIGDVKSDTSFQRMPPDTVKTPILYLDPQNQNIVGALAFRISVDTFYFDSVAPKVFNKIPKRESYYFIPVWVAKTDSAGQVVKDAAGKPVPMLTYPPLDKLLLLEDYNRKFK